MFIPVPQKDRFDFLSASSALPHKFYGKEKGEWEAISLLKAGENGLLAMRVVL